MSPSNIFFIIAGVVATILGILALVVVSFVVIWVWVLGYDFNLHYEKTKKNGTK